MITQLQLDALVGKRIGDICPNGFVRDVERQAAHFVGHVLRLQVAPTCQMDGGHQPGVSVAIDVIFSRCPTVGVWSLRPTTVTACLVFSTPLNAVQLQTKMLKPVPRQQVGIFLNGCVWRYSPSRGVVVKDTAVHFAQQQAPGFALFYGLLP